MTRAVSTTHSAGARAGSAEAATGRGVDADASSAERAAFTILIDGECPLCRHEARLLARFDKGRGRLRLVDITDPGFDAGAYGATYDEVMGSIHGVTADGELVTGMEVFRRAYAAVGWGWLWAPTGWPVLKPVFDFAYKIFARYRLRLTGRGDVCEGGRCKV